MEKLAVKILRRLRNAKAPISRQDLITEFGAEAPRALDYLFRDNYIKQGQKRNRYRSQDDDRAFVPDGMYSIDSGGMDYLQRAPGIWFDKWITRISAIVGFITGVLSLILHLSSG